MQAVVRAFVLLVIVLLIAGSVVAYSVANRGLSTRVPPSALETTVALTMRRAATPSASGAD